jgi:hypothetical protein
MVAAWRPVASAGRRALHDHVERLVVDAKRLGMDVADVLDLVRREWK